MKKIVLTSLFSATLLFGSFGTAAFADELVPTDPSTPSVEVPTDPSIPVTPTEPTTPVETPVDPDIPPVTQSEPTVPVEPEQPTEPSQPTVPSEPAEPVDQTEPSQPTVPIEPTEPTKPTEPSTTPSTSEEPTKPVEKPTEERPNPSKPAEPAEEMTVTVTPSGQPTSNKSQGTSVPIVTSDVDELTYIPTPTTPLKVATGQEIVGVLDGVPLVKNEQGEFEKDLSIPVKKLPSGNIEIKTVDGKTKVLPKTGEETRTVLSVLGLILVSITTFFGYKKTKIF
ncbi:LPXTG cell wall anchor domain-containing protein [Enterococcus gallinarum]|uniref:LPXTG cell wall anchor domain-containing protein n=1 Tax=Enterococcus TaxID=1350 RepID=UPI003F75D78F